VIKRVEQLSVSTNAGNSHLQGVFKPVVTAASVAGGWVDASMSSGTPIYNAYVGGQLESTALTGQKNQSVFTGQSNQVRYLMSALFQTRSACVPAFVMIMDYLKFYPLVDLDSTDVQETSEIDSLPRYEDGAGVMIMPVVTLPSTTFTNCTISYTNSDGVPGRLTTFRLLAATTVGSVSASPASNVAGMDSPFVPLANGDRGVRSIETIQLAAGVGGFCCFVLVKPLATVVVPEINTCSEVSFIGNKNTLPKILPGAFINFAVKTQAVAASSWVAQLNFVGE